MVCQCRISCSMIDDVLIALAGRLVKIYSFYTYLWLVQFPSVSLGSFSVKHQIVHPRMTYSDGPILHQGTIEAHLISALLSKRKLKVVWSNLDRKEADQSIRKLGN